MKQHPTKTVMVCGSRDLKGWKHDEIAAILLVQSQAINNILARENVYFTKFIVGDAPGVDTVFIDMHRDSKKNMTVYSCGDPRVKNIGYFQVKTQHNGYPERDYALCRDSDILIAICIADSRGTTSNISQMKDDGKEVFVVYLPPKNESVSTYKSTAHEKITHYKTKPEHMKFAEVG